MNKNDILKVFDLASFVSVIIATILVMLFQFTGNSLLVKYGVIIYTAGFLMLTVFYSLKTYFVFAKKSDGEEEQFELEKKQKGFLILKLVLSLVAFIFTAIIMILL